MAIHDLTGGKTDPTDPQVRSFVRGNLFLSDRDAAILLEHVSATRRRMRDLERRMEGPIDEDAGHQLRDQADQVVLAGRDDLPIIKQGMSHGASP